jgi:ABC-type transport system involved in cytochrome c biogenesis ATPase subunit
VTAPSLFVRIKKRLGAFELDVAFEGGAGVTVLFGPSGAGKSATLAAIAGALRLDGGRIALPDTVLYDKAARIDLAPELRGIGWVFRHRLGISGRPAVSSFERRKEPSVRHGAGWEAGGPHPV